MWIKEVWKHDCVWAPQTKRLVIVVFLQRVRNERQAATGTRDYYFFHSSQRALEDWTTEARRPASHPITQKGPFSFLHSSGFIFLPGGFFFFFWTLTVDWKGCIYLNYHLLFECALTTPSPLQPRFIIACGGIKKKEPLRNHLVLAKQKGNVHTKTHRLCVSNIL